MTERDRHFIQIFTFLEDKTKNGRVLSTAKIGEVFMSRLTIRPGVTTGNYYHKKTKLMFYVEKGRVKAAFENVKTKEKKLTEFWGGKHVIHVPPGVALATKNVGKTKAVIVFFSNRALRDQSDSFSYEIL